MTWNVITGLFHKLLPNRKAAINEAVYHLDFWKKPEYKTRILMQMIDVHGEIREQVEIMEQ